MPFLIFGFLERTKKKDKREFITKSIGIILTIIFMQKPLKPLKPLKPFEQNVFFADHLNHKTLNKTTCGTHSANSRQICAH